MNTIEKQHKPALVGLIISLLCLPLVGAYFRWGGLPPEFGLLAQVKLDVPPFSLPIFLLASSVASVFVVFLVFPSLFGFKKPSISVVENSKKPSAKLPSWFYIGLLMTITFWVIMWGKFEALGAITHFVFVPLWLGFILLLDGFLYKRNNGKSLVSHRRKLLALSALFSSFSWYYFEYLNHFVRHNWHYPDLTLVSGPGTYVLSMLTFATVLPVLFIWYNLLRTFPSMVARYSDGPKIVLGSKAKVAMFFAGIICYTITTVWSEFLFWMVWLGPLMFICVLLDYLKIWTPVADIAKGDWSASILIAVGTVFNGFFWEMWNGFSAPTNPNFWVYNIPYVQKFLVFEMPLLGYSGYLFFGVECWVLFIVFGKLFNFNTNFSVVPETETGTGSAPNKAGE